MSGLSPSGLNILIAEDDATLGKALSGFLREKGHRVDWAGTGGEALKLIHHNLYSLVITDLVMPEADGLEVLRAARQRHPATLVVLMTGYASIDSAIQATREGAYDYLRKPFKLQELDIAVANASRLLRLKQENQRLLEKLNDLTARLEDLENSCHNQQYVLDQPDKARSSPVVLPLPFPFVHDQDRQQQGDLDRLRNLYKEELLSEQEFNKLKQRLLI
jgi:DNA-binding NtrC family response regulator